MLPTPGHSLAQSDSSGYLWASGLNMAQEEDREVTASCRGQNGGSEGLHYLLRAAKARLETCRSSWSWPPTWPQPLT